MSFSFMSHFLFMCCRCKSQEKLRVFKWSDKMDDVLLRTFCWYSDHMVQHCEIHRIINWVIEVIVWFILIMECRIYVFIILWCTLYHEQAYNLVVGGMC